MQMPAMIVKIHKRCSTNLSPRVPGLSKFKTDCITEVFQLTPTRSLACHGEKFTKWTYMDFAWTWSAYKAAAWTEAISLLKPNAPEAKYLFYWLFCVLRNWEWPDRGRGGFILRIMCEMLPWACMENRRALAQFDDFGDAAIVQHSSY